MIKELQEFVVYKTGKEIKELIDLRINKSLVSSAHELSPQDNLDLRVLHASVKDSGTYPVKIPLMSILLGLDI